MHVNRRKIAMFFLMLLAVGAFIYSRRLLPSKAKQLQPLLSELDGFKATNGIYPTSYVSFASFSNLTQRFSVYTGKRETNGLVWETAKVSDHDFTVMVDGAGYEVFLPVGRMGIFSFSSFPVWRYSSSDHRWQKGRIHWSYAIGYTGSYWSEN